MVINNFKWMYKKWGIRGVTLGQLTIICVPLDDSRLKTTENHEAIHRAQFKECGGIVKTMMIYYREYFTLKKRYSDGHTASQLTGFEQEAYSNADNQDYLKTREAFAWKKYKI